MKSNLDMLFIVPSSQNDFGVVQAAYRPEFNLGIGYLVAYCKQKGFDVDFVDMGTEGYSISELCSFIKKKKPAVIGITIVTLMMDVSIKIACAVKAVNRKILIVVGGPHPTALPEQTLKEAPFDVVVRGEGEITCTKLLERYLNGNSFHGLHGITFKDGKKIVSERASGFVKDLDELPFAYRKSQTIHLYKNQVYFDDSTATSYNLIATRGCPYRCTFCGQSVIFDQKVRRRSAKNVFAEIEMAYKKHNIRFFFFEDSTFVFSKTLVEELCRLLINSSMKVKWGAMGRLDLVDEGFYSLMKKAGCVFLCFGVESGNNEILKSIKKKFTVEQARKAVKIVHKAGIPFNTSFILGFPEDTKETIRGTIDFAKELNADYVSFSLATPYPGSEFYNTVTTNGWKIDNWIDYEQSRYNIPVYVPDGLNKEELANLLRVAYREFYFRVKYVVRHIRNIKSWSLFLNHVKMGLSLMLRKNQ